MTSYCLLIIILIRGISTQFITENRLIITVQKQSFKQTKTNLKRKPKPRTYKVLKQNN